MPALHQYWVDQTLHSKLTSRTTLAGMALRRGADFRTPGSQSGCKLRTSKPKPCTKTCKALVAEDAESPLEAAFKIACEANDREARKAAVSKNASQLTAQVARRHAQGRMFLILELPGQHDVGLPGPRALGKFRDNFLPSSLQWSETKAGRSLASTRPAEGRDTKSKD